MDVTTLLLTVGAVAGLLFFTAKVLALRIKTALRAVLNALLGVGALLLVNATSAFTGWAGCIDPVSVLTSIAFGVPGVGVVLLLRWILT